MLGETIDDLVSDGNLSLMRAVEKFDYGRGNKFSTYATWAIIKNFARSIFEDDLNILAPSSVCPGAILGRNRFSDDGAQVNERQSLVNKMRRRRTWDNVANTDCKKEQKEQTAARNFSHPALLTSGLTTTITERKQFSGMSLRIGPHAI